MVGVLRPAILSALVYGAVAAAMGWAVLQTPGTVIAGDVGDPVLNAAILAWNAQQIPWSAAWFQFPGFHPAADALTFSEHLLGVSLLASPIRWMSGSTLTAYNLTLLLSYVLCGVSMYALVWRLTRHAPASFLAGLAFAFAPYRAGHLVHIQVLAVFYAPLALLGLHEFMRDRRWRWLCLFATCWLLQGAANGYFLVFFSILVGLWIAWFSARRRRWRDLAYIAAAMITAAVPLAPILARFFAAHRHYGFARTTEEITTLSADIAAPLCAPAGLLAWGWLDVACGPEGALFPGAALIAMCALGVWATRRATLRSTSLFYFGAAAVMWAFSWGPSPRLFGQPALPQGPYAWLMWLPGMEGLRVPARFWMMTVLCLCVAFGVTAAAWLSGRRVAVVRLCTAAAAAGLLLDGWTAITAAMPRPGPPNPGLLRGQVVLTLPIDYGRDVAAQLYAADGGWRSVNGASGFFPPHYARLRQASDNRDPVVFEPFVRRGDLHVVVEANAGVLVDLVADQPGAERTGDGDGWVQFRIPARAGGAAPGQGEQLRIASLSASCAEERVLLTLDGDRATRWDCGPQAPGEQQLTIDLGAVVQVGAVVPALGVYERDEPNRLLVETSVDGVTWASAWDAGVRVEALEAMMRDPRTIPLTVTFSPRRARYVRLQQTGRDDRWFWSVAGLEVWSGDPPSGR